MCYRRPPSITLLDTASPHSDDLTEAEIEAALLSLVGKRFILPDTTYSFGAAQAYRFRRAVGHEAAYDSLSPAARLAQHARVAQWLLANQNDAHFRAWFPVDGMIAYHLAAGGEATRAFAWRQRTGQPHGAG